MKYPHAKTLDISDDYHGTVVADPYRWLEDPDSSDTREWVARQNELSQEYFRAFSGRDAVARRFRELWDYPRYSLPVRRGEHYFFSKNDGLQNQPVLYVQESLAGEPRALLDPNTLSDDGTIALTGEHYTHDGAMLAYGLSQAGSDWQTVRVRDVATGRDRDDVIQWCRFSGVGWKRDGSGFWYNRFPAEGEVPPEDRNNYNRVYWHYLGTPQESDELVYSDDGRKELGFVPYVTDDGDYVCLFVYHGTDPRNGIYLRRTDGDSEFLRLYEHEVAKFSPIDNVGTEFYFHTDLDAPRGRVIAVDVARPGSAPREVIPQGDDVIDSVTLAGDCIVVCYLRDANHRLVVYQRDGRLRREIELPALGSVEGMSGRRLDDEMFFSFTSFVFPTTQYRYHFPSDELSVFRASEAKFDPSDYVTRQMFCTSKDGTRVPMFVTHHRDVEYDGGNAVWLYGYGGFNISLTPGFQVSRLPWLEAGGVYVVANLRGGGEYGEEWHRQGTLAQKQNVFDDFIAAAEFLCAENITRPDRIVINGGSNGGLLVAACMVQRPDLFGAVVCQVPVVDMLRYHKFTIGRYWVSDYGNAEADPEHFRFLYAYSPLHNVGDGVKYPPTLIVTADTDDRVVPAHAKKFAATLQAHGDGGPILVRVETRAGHGLGKPTSKVIEEFADIYAFLFRALEIPPAMPR